MTGVQTCALPICVGGAGVVTALIGVIRMAGAPRGDRFDPPRSAAATRVRLLGGLQSVGLSVTF